MKLDCILTAVNINLLYIDFIPIFIKTWNKLYPLTDIKIILISNNIPDEFKIYSNNIILFPPLEGISTAFTAQYIRILYPAILNYSNGILITDIDMLPMNRNFFIKNFKKYTTNKFIYTGGDILNQYFICYNIATPKIWSEIFSIKSIQDIKDRIINVFNNNIYVEGHGNIGWSIDQEDLYKYINKWSNKRDNFIILNNSRPNRLNRNNFSLNDNIIKNIINGVYDDYHAWRPFKKYAEINNKIYKLI